MKKGFTVTELIFVIAVLAILGCWLLPSLQKAKHRAQRIRCVSHLKQIGLAHRLFANDHNNLYPAFVSTNKGGSLEFVSTTQVFRHFAALSNVLGVTVILVCPADAKRKEATTFETLNNTNLSYFINLDAREDFPNEWLSGDRNLKHSVKQVNGSYPFTSNTVVGWLKSSHVEAGNIGLSDGSVRQTTSSYLQESLKHSTQTNRISIP